MKGVLYMKGNTGVTHGGTGVTHGNTGVTHLNTGVTHHNTHVFLFANQVVEEGIFSNGLHFQIGH